MARLKILVPLLVVLAVVSALIVPTIASAQPLVCQFYGSVKLNGAAVADGTTVTAWIDFAQVGSTTTTGSNYTIKLGGVDWSNKLVAFKIGDVLADQLPKWTAGGNVQANLTFGVAPTPTPTPSPIKVVKANALPAGSTPSVTYDPATQTLTFGIPAGAQGDKGAAGAKGDTGAPGAPGAAGAKGDTGATGPKGDTGPAGPKGDTGAQGAQGPVGPEGKEGGKAFGIVGLIVAIVALLGTGFVLMRKPAAPPSK